MLAGDFVCALDNDGTVHCFGNGPNQATWHDPPAGILFSYIDSPNIGFATGIGQAGLVHYWGHEGTPGFPGPNGPSPPTTVYRHSTSLPDMNR